jgi:hypothetical protein
LLLDTSGTYTAELEKAQKVMNYLLSDLQSGDSFAIARIDSGSFSEKDIIAKKTFSDKPSQSNAEKREFKQSVDDYLASLQKGSAFTDISGGVLQGLQYLSETGAGRQYLFIFSDLEEDLQEGLIRDFEYDMPNTAVIALNVTKLGSDNVDPKRYQQRLAEWQQRVEEAGGQWAVVNDLQRLEQSLALLD